jgi:putative two-component system response regulator
MTANPSELANCTILVVDDEPGNLALMNGLLRDTYTVKGANSGERALQIIQDNRPNLILLDIIMPGMSGYDVCRTLKEDPSTQDIPIIFLTSNSDAANEKMGFDLGAVDYITKPVSPPVVLARIRTHLENKASKDFLKDQNTYLEAEVKRRTEEIRAIQTVTIRAMASLAETRDNDTGNHIRRTQYYVKALADAMKKHPRFQHYLSENQIEQLFKSAPLHDIGKVGIPDHILLKPGRLTVEEFETMKSHALLGAQSIDRAAADLGRPTEFLECAREIAGSHHEKWDGSGYPQGLLGDAIPIAARFMALVDVYDALISRRVYKEPMTHEAAKAIILEGRGSHFDPDIVDAFVSIQDEFIAIAERYADSH